jgi:ATP-dependent DNA helicase RecG
LLENPTDLLEKINLGEDSFLELKEVRFAKSKVAGPSRASLADELAAFANSPRGGVCVLGVEDKSREIVGIALERLDVVEDFVREVCLASIIPPLAPTIERLKLPSAAGDFLPVIKIDIAQSLFVHKSPGGYLHRVGSAKREMSPDYLARLFQQRSQTRIIRFDEQPVPGAVLDDLHADLWRRFASSRIDEPREVLLGKLAMATTDTDGVLRPTVAVCFWQVLTPAAGCPTPSFKPCLTVVTLCARRVIISTSWTPKTSKARSTAKCSWPVLL